MATLNTNYKKLEGAYLFSEIAKRTADFLKKNPSVALMRLGIGDTTLPLTPSVIRGLNEGVKKLSKAKTYTGYGNAQGDVRLRNALVSHYQKRGVQLSPEEVFISDGAKSDSANIQSIFSENNVVAVADPVYTVYVDSNVIAGRTGEFKNGRYSGLVYMSCTEKNGFVPLPPTEKADILYLCSPNNPTGAVMTKKELQAFVDYAIKNKSVIIFDASYAEYIQDEKLPKSIYEIKDAKKCAIEINSFSKWCGFTGVRLGWTVVPNDLVCEGSDKGMLNNIWRRRQSTMFNGASNISQEGALAALSSEGQNGNKKLVGYYMENAALIKKNLVEIGFKVWGGEHAPYVWAKIPLLRGQAVHMSSWEFFDKLLHEAHVVATPGSGFGREGEGYMRFSAFGERENIKKAMQSIKNNLKIKV